MSYIGNQLSSSAFVTDVFSGTGSQTAFSGLTFAPAATPSIAVFVGGSYQSPTSYSVSGTTLTFNSAPAAGTNNIQVLHLGTGATAVVPSDGSVTGVKIASSAITGDKIVANTIGTSNLTTTGVTAGIYGGTTNVSVITISADGRITSASNTAVSGIDAHPFVFTALGS